MNELTKRVRTRDHPRRTDITSHMRSSENSKSLAYLANRSVVFVVAGIFIAD